MGVAVSGLSGLSRESTAEGRTWCRVGGSLGKLTSYKVDSAARYLEVLQTERRYVGKSPLEIPDFCNMRFINRGPLLSDCMLLLVREGDTYLVRGMQEPVQISRDVRYRFKVGEHGACWLSIDGAWAQFYTEGGVEVYQAEVYR